MKFHFWHTTLSIFFLLLLAFAIEWLGAMGRLAAFIPAGDFLLMTLAIMRLVRLTTYDNITAFVRDWFVGYEPESFLGSLGTLINCPWCTGLWWSLIVAFSYFASPYAWYVILILALSAAASFLQIMTNAMGWIAEAKKREANTPILPR